VLFLLIVFRGEIKEREKESKGENREEIDEKVERGENVFNYLQFLLSLFLSVASVKLSISSLKNKRTYFQKENETPSFLIIIKFHPNKIYFKQ